MTVGFFFLIFFFTTFKSLKAILEILIHTVVIWRF